jgi:RNA polymerase sigma-70 factor (ECF subfamily)
MTLQIPLPPTADDKHEHFMALYLQVQPLLISYLRTIIPSASDRDDIQQEVSTALWRQFDRYDTTRPFLPWAMGITHNHVARWRRQRAIAQRRFSPETEAILAEAFANCEDELLERRRALQSCVERLNKNGRSLIHQRYACGLSLDTIAERNGSSLNAINKALGKIRRLLGMCTERLMMESS